MVQFLSFPFFEDRQDRQTCRGLEEEADVMPPSRVGLAVLRVTEQKLFLLPHPTHTHPNLAVCPRTEQLA